MRFVSQARKLFILWLFWLIQFKKSCFISSKTLRIVLRGANALQSLRSNAQWNSATSSKWKNTSFHFLSLLFFCQQLITVIYCLLSFVSSFHDFHIFLLHRSRRTERRDFNLRISLACIYFISNCYFTSVQITRELELIIIFREKNKKLTCLWIEMKQFDCSWKTTRCSVNTVCVSFQAQIKPWEFCPETVRVFFFPDENAQAAINQCDMKRSFEISRYIERSEMIWIETRSFEMS